MSLGCRPTCAVPLMTIEFLATVVLSGVTMVHAHLYCVLLSVDVLHCLHNTTPCVCTTHRWRLSVRSYIYVCACVFNTRERETTARLLFSRSFSLQSILPLNACVVHCLPPSSSLIRCENKNNCISLRCSIFADKLFSDQPYRRESARQLDATVTDGFDKHTRGTFE